MPRPAWDNQFRETLQERAERLRASLRQQEAQKVCKHSYQGVPGTTAYLKCSKCGARTSND